MSPTATSADVARPWRGGVLPHRAGHLLKRVAFRTDEVMVLEDPGAAGRWHRKPTRDSIMSSVSRGRRAKHQPE
jgi:hypothetical protein